MKPLGADMAPFSECENAWLPLIPSDDDFRSVAHPSRAGGILRAQLESAACQVTLSRATCAKLSSPVSGEPNEPEDG